MTSYLRLRRVSAPRIAQEMGWSRRQLLASQRRQPILWRRSYKGTLGGAPSYDAGLIDALRALRDEPHREVTAGPNWLDRYLEEGSDATQST